MVQFYPRRIQKIESLLAERELWMTIGKGALARHQNLQPHRHIVGLRLCPSQTDKDPPETFPSCNMNMAEALHRAYGGPEQTDPSPAPFT